MKVFLHDCPICGACTLSTMADQLICSECKIPCVIDEIENPGPNAKHVAALCDNKRDEAAR